MTYLEVMHELERVGTAQARKIYRRHGVKTELFGVSYKELGRIEKKIKINHELALQLWDSATHDAMVLACKIADPKVFTKDDARIWILACSDYIVTDAFSFLVSKMQRADAYLLAEEFIESESEWISSSGWTILSILVQRRGVEDSSVVHNYLNRIKTGIHKQPNRTRYAMNNTLIAIGGFVEGMHDAAIQVANAVGTVEVDHGETGCKTPKAAPYIEKILKRNAERQSQKKSA